MKKKSVLLSVIVPVYNVENYIEECIQALINQTFRDLEIVLVDDGSTDNSGIICDKYKEKDDRIVLIHTTNKGPASARKMGLKIAKGQYICFVDSDDYFSEYMYENMINSISDTDFDFVHFNYYDDNKLNSGIRNSKSYYNSDSRTIIENVFNRGNDGNQIIQSFFTKIFREDFIRVHLEKVSDQCYYGEDLICMCHMLLSGCNFAVDKRAFYHYRSRQGSLCHTRSFDAYQRINNMYNWLSTLNKEYTNDSDLEAEIEKYYLHVLKSTLYNNCEEFLYPIDKIETLRNKKIIIYGAGKCGKDYYRQLRLYSDIEIVAWIDKKANEIENDFFPLSSLDVIEKVDFDKIIIGILNTGVSAEVSNELIARGVDKQKIVF